jgi:hypothetical protein
MLGAARHEREADVRAMKQLIVGAVSTGSFHGGTTDAAVTDTRADVYASQVQVSEMRAVGFDPDRDVLSVQWYYAPPGGVGWAVLPHVSGTMEPGQDTDGTHYVLSPNLSATTPPACLGEGQDRAEIYVIPYPLVQVPRRGSLCRSGDRRRWLRRDRPRLRPRRLLRQRRIQPGG